MCDLSLKKNLINYKTYPARTAWIPRIISWTMQFGDDPESQTTWLPSITEDLIDEIDEIWTRLDVVYSLTRISMRPANQVGIVSCAFEDF